MTVGNRKGARILRIVAHWELLPLVGVIRRFWIRPPKLWPRASSAFGQRPLIDPHLIFSALSQILRAAYLYILTLPFTYQIAHVLQFRHSMEDEYFIWGILHQTSTLECVFCRIFSDGRSA